MAKEARQAGIPYCYSPVQDVVRDPRYGRVEECYGEDPYLVSRMGVAFIQGLQGTGEERFDENHVMATAKHFAGYSEPQQGLNGAYVDISRRTLYEIFLPPFEKAVKEARVGCIMPAHSDLNGIPCHMNKWLLTDLLRNEWGFDGYVESDNFDIYRLHEMHRAAETREEAAVLALKAGVDMDLVLRHDPERMIYNSEFMLKALEQDPSLEEYINTSVRRILKAKFELGLFESYTEPKTMIKSSEVHKALSIQAAKESIVLLKNEDHLLPLDKDQIGTIAVIGSNAHDDELMEREELLGGYSDMPPEFISVYSGLKNKAGNDLRVIYAEGCKLLDHSTEGFDEALQAGRQAEVIVMVLGSSTLTCKEGFDRDEIDLIGKQEKLLKEISALGKPVVLVLINGRPLSIPWAAENIPAIVEAWYPGMLGGKAIADVLFGDHNPGGKLTVSFPHKIGQLPVVYFQKPDFTGMGRGQYVGEPDKTPLYPFGFGLSYTTFTYQDIALVKDTISVNDETKAIVVEPGDFTIMIGSSSRNENLIETNLKVL